MLIKLGVDISRLDHSIRSKLGVIEKILDPVTPGGETVLTSTWEGKHASWSLHYAHKAVDFRKPYDTATATATVGFLKRDLGASYDVVLEDTHIHVEFDPK